MRWTFCNLWTMLFKTSFKERRCAFLKFPAKEESKHMATLKGVHYKSLLLSAIMAGYFIHFANFFFDGFLGMFSNQMAPLQNEQWGFLFGHMFNSIFFAWVYAKYAMNRLPGPNIIKGIIYGVILYVVVMVTMMIV